MAERDARAAGIFMTHELSPRIKRHFLRLVVESGPFVDWHFVHNGGNDPRPLTPIPYRDPAEVMPTRYGRMLDEGMIEGGYLDVMHIPLVLALEAKHVWVMEYDVDYSGSWGDLFSQFRDVSADLLAATLQRPPEFPEWLYWPTCSAPSWVARTDYIRGFIPMMRLSRDFAHHYAELMVDPEWREHSEFTIPTAALASGAEVEDLGRDGGTFTPAGRAINYSGDGRDGSGTFAWRPVREHYFHEAPAAFEEPNRMYHPVKPEVESWERWS